MGYTYLVTFVKVNFEQIALLETPLKHQQWQQMERVCQKQIKQSTLGLRPMFTMHAAKKKAAISCSVSPNMEI